MKHLSKRRKAFWTKSLFKIYQLCTTCASRLLSYTNLDKIIIQVCFIYRTLSPYESKYAICNNEITHMRLNFTFYNVDKIMTISNQTYAIHVSIYFENKIGHVQLTFNGVNWKKLKLLLVSFNAIFQIFKCWIEL